MTNSMRHILTGLFMAARLPQRYRAGHIISVLWETRRVNLPKIGIFRVVRRRFANVIMSRHAHGEVLFPSFQVPYEAGCIRAAAYDENGGVIAEDIRKSFKDPARLVLRADKSELRADGEDLVFVEIGMEDEDGNPVENAILPDTYNKCPLGNPPCQSAQNRNFSCGTAFGAAHTDRG